MSRLRTLLTLTTVLAIAAAGVASAHATKRIHIAGGTTQLTISPAAASRLSANSISLAAVAPATSSGSTFTFPIARGRLNPANLHGRLIDQGGLTVSNGTTTLDFRHLALTSNGNQMSVYAFGREPTTRACHRSGRRPRQWRCVVTTRYGVARIAKVTGLTTSAGTTSGTAYVTAFTAHVLNALAGKKIAAAGASLGTVAITPTLNPAAPPAQS
jgi:hypothetical protein